MIGDTFLPGEYFVYCCGSHWELGKVKRRCDDKPDFYFCYYSRGTTAARTCTSMMQKLANGDGGPANQYTLGDYAATRICDSVLKVTNFFTDDPIWCGKAGGPAGGAEPHSHRGVRNRYGRVMGHDMLDRKPNRNVIVLRTIDLDVRWDQLTDRIFLHDTIGDELLIVSRETLCEIVQTLDTMSLSAM